MTEAPQAGLPVLDPRPDIRLIAADMDGTLLDDAGDLHEHFWPMIHELGRRGVLFCPASGRQYYTLRELFEEIADDVVFIAENGTYVVRRDREISSSCVTSDEVRLIVTTLRRTFAGGVDAGIVVCGKSSAYIDRTDQRFLDEVTRYYARLQIVDDVLYRPDDEILKVSVFDFGPIEHLTAPSLAEFHETHMVTVSGAHWIDLTNRAANKGRAIRDLQAAYDISPAQTMVFGDFLNDLEMMDAAEYSFAMDNAHPTLRARARYVAPSNLENGVVRTISAVLGLPWIH